MSGTSGWDILGLLGLGGSKSLGDISGAASNLASGNPSAVNQAAWAMNPALTGIPETSQSLAATTSTGGDWKWPSSKELAETLKGAGKSSGSSSGSGSDDSIKGSSLVSSGAHAGSGGISSDTVYKLLMARATPTVGQQKQGLLGV